MKIAVFAAAALAAAPAVARTPAIVVSQAWIAAPPAGAPTAAGYVTLTNSSGTPDVLVSAATPAAETMALHSMSMAAGIMRMRPVTGGAPIPAGGALILAPGGDYHFMLVRPRRPLHAGDRVPATLTFARAGAVRVVFTVRTSPPPSDRP